MQYQIGEVTRVGHRDLNQDRFVVLYDDERVLLTVADGMGGHPKGEVAAQIAVDSLSEGFQHSKPEESPKKQLVKFFDDANRSIMRYGRKRAMSVHPGTTCVTALLVDKTLHWGHIGDSRLYVIREGEIFYRSRDHSYVQDLVDAGLIQADECNTHPFRNQITQCMGGVPGEVKMDLGGPLDLEEGDVVLLCTDGFWSSLTDEELLDGINRLPIQDALEMLAAKAENNVAPNSDNVTAIALSWEGE